MYLFVCVCVHVCVVWLFVCVCMQVIPRAGGQDLVPKMLVRKSDRTKVDLPRPDSPEEGRSEQQ